MDTAFYCSFLVRLWREPPEVSGAVRGEVEAIQSGQVVMVHSLDEALELLRQAVGHSQPPASPTPESDCHLTDSEGAIHDNTYDGPSSVQETSLRAPVHRRSTRRRTGRGDQYHPAHGWKGCRH